MKADNIEIEENLITGGICAYFNAGEQRFFADISRVYDIGNECMIFPCKDRHVTSWIDLYCKRNIPMSEQSLRECIDDFVDNCLS